MPCFALLGGRSRWWQVGNLSLDRQQFEGLTSSFKKVDASNVKNGQLMLSDKCLARIVRAKVTYWFVSFSTAQHMSRANCWEFPCYLVCGYFVIALTGFSSAAQVKLVGTIAWSRLALLASLTFARSAYPFVVLVIAKILHLLRVRAPTPWTLARVR